MNLLNTIILILVYFLIYYLISSKKCFFNNKDIKLAIHTVFLPKENNIFLEEWIDYHLNLGFDQIYIYIIIMEVQEKEPQEKKIW